MFLPVGDTPNPKNFTPWVTWILMGVNVVIYLVINLPLGSQPVDPRDPMLQEYLRLIAPSLPAHVSPLQVVHGLSAYDLFVFAHGFKPAAAEWSDLLFSMFLHGGIAHLFGNMLFLWIYGDNIEHRLGRFRYLLAYLAGGVAATLFFGLFAGRSMVPMIGASGAISGVLGLYFLLFPHNRIKVFIFLFPILMETVLLPARFVLGVYLVLDNLLPFFIGSSSGVAHGAHIGGFLAGLAIAFVGERFAWRVPGAIRLAGTDAGETVDGADLPSVAQLQQAIRTDDRAGALHLAAAADGHSLVSLDPTDCIRLAGWLEAAGYGPAASRLLRGCLGRHRDSPELYLQLGLLRLNQGQDAAAYQYLLDALDHDPDPQTARQAREALQRIALFRRP